MAKKSNGWCSVAHTLERVFVAANTSSGVCFPRSYINSKGGLSSTGRSLGRRVVTPMELGSGRRILAIE